MIYMYVREAWGQRDRERERKDFEMMRRVCTYMAREASTMFTCYSKAKFKTRIAKYCVYAASLC